MAACSSSPTRRGQDRAPMMWIGRSSSSGLRITVTGALSSSNTSIEAAHPARSLKMIAGISSPPTMSIVPSVHAMGASHHREQPGTCAPWATLTAPAPPATAPPGARTAARPPTSAGPPDSGIRAYSSHTLLLCISPTQPDDIAGPGVRCGFERGPVEPIAHATRAVPQSRAGYGSVARVSIVNPYWAKWRSKVKAWVMRSRSITVKLIVSVLGRDGPSWANADGTPR